MAERAPDPEVVAIRVADPSQVGEARRAAALLSDAVGLDATTAGCVAIVVTELATNLVKHAARGEIVLRGFGGAGDGAGDDGRGVDVVAIDAGPGMADVESSMRDGHSTAGSAGAGLGAIRRQSTVLDVYSTPGRGTVILSRIETSGAAQERVRASRRLELGVVRVPKFGERECGDDWCALATSPNRMVVAVCDGLGHGPLAAQSARVGIAAVAANADASPSGMMAAAHAALRSTRGAAVAITELDLDAGTMRFCGLGQRVRRDAVRRRPAQPRVAQRHGRPRVAACTRILI
jgi:anti-sigma regulatory factor (Ser/Thr protein kinase)